MEDYNEGYFDGWIPCYFKEDGIGGTDIVGKNWFYSLLIDIWLPIAGLRPKGFMIKVKDK